MKMSGQINSFDVLKAAITWTEAPPNDPQPLRCVIIKRVQWTQRDRGVTFIRDETGEEKDILVFKYSILNEDLIEKNKEKNKRKKAEMCC